MTKGSAKLRLEAGLRWRGEPYVNNVKRLRDGGLGVERESGIDLGGDLAGDDLEDLLAELDEEVVQGGVDLGVDGAALGLGLGHGGV